MIFDVERDEVFQEVARTTSYTGAKMTGDGAELAYERIFTTDEDRLMLQRFWAEACQIAADRMKQFIVDYAGAATSFNIKLELSKRFDSNLAQSIESSLTSWFVNSIVSKWYLFTNKAEATIYGEAATAALDDAVRKLYYKKKPERQRVLTQTTDNLKEAESTDDTLKTPHLEDTEITLTSTEITEDTSD